ncbi:anthranilate synthase component 1 [Thorsellia anophelis]|uniref:Anthranilate synthase component 1 n=1 Tax=Thorsellia anophelis DSM 18579 TaxID=1123402 RepID=A0A1I0BKR7_9GAMM|nr:anthranilate synthase, component I [Thorsellia anophelis DSM 18579]
MSGSNSKRKINLMRMDVPYHADPTLTFQHICKNRSATLLLESAEIASKDNLKSMMIVDSAVRISAYGKNVEIEALTQNGNVILSYLINNLPDEITFDLKEFGTKLELKLPTISQELDEDERLKSTSVFDILRTISCFDTSNKENTNAIFLGGLFAYELINQYEVLPDVENKNNCPDLCFYLAEVMLFIDHKTKTSYLQSALLSNDTAERVRLISRLKQLHDSLNQPLEQISSVKVERADLNVNFDDETYCNQVAELQKNIIAGDIFQVVPSRRFSLPCPAPLAAYQTLKGLNPSPYMFYMQDTLFTLFGASPESALKYDNETRQLEIYPIAGTRPRGKNADGSINLDLDSRLEFEVRNDHKELSEHIMLVDLARNDLSKVCEPGSRYVADLTKVDRYSVVMHLVSRVVGKLRSDLDVLHAYQACMNMGTLTGAPKIRAMELIAKTENTKRGSYGGAIGYLNSNGDFDTCIVIRSAYVENGTAYVQAGAGVVLDSVPQLEADESRAKASAVLTAIKIAHQMQES